MKRTLLFSLKLLLFFLICISYSCTKRECNGEDKTVDYKLTTNLLSFFPYKSFDTLKFKVDSQYSYEAVSNEFVDGINKKKIMQDYECGYGTIYNNHNRIVKYYDKNNRSVFEAKFEAIERYIMSFGFSFPNTELKQSYQFRIYDFETGDTLTIDGIFYDDIFVKIEESRSEMYFYSKSQGLIKVIAQNKVVFRKN